jgi:putative heme-binding domain-containing protein
MAPDLTNIGTRPLALIKESIVDPSKGLSLLGQEAVTVTLKDGQAVRGIARNRNNYSLQVVDQQGTLHLISMIDVKELAISEKSAMPGDYAKRLSGEGLQNLLAYLAQQSVRPPGTGKKQEAK